VCWGGWVGGRSGGDGWVVDQAEMGQDEQIGEQMDAGIINIFNTKRCMTWFRHI